MKIAVIDIGTNSIHMMIAEIHPNFTFEVIGREKEMTRLGDGTLSSGYLSEDIMTRGLATLKKFQLLAKSKGAQKILAVATSAVREAHNGGDFLQRVLEEASLKVRVITGEEEGRLIYQGVKHSVELAKNNTLMIDIGGGSIELMIVNPEKILLVKSLKLGAARLKDLFLKKNSKAEFEALEAYATEKLREVDSEILRLGFSQVIGTSGTLINLAAMTASSHQPVNSAFAPSLSWEDLKKLYRQLQNSNSEELSKMKGLDPRRHDLILSGAAVAYLLMKIFKIENLAVCDKAMREGMIYDYISRHRQKIKSEAEIPDLRRRNILKLAMKCDYEKGHAEHVADLALQIFDQTKDWHHLNSVDRELLEYSSLLHDIGYHISYEKHHRHAYYLIKNVSLNGFSGEEIDIMALTVRYHRRSSPKKTHPEFGILSKNIRERVAWLASILRIADALDRSHFSVVQKLKIKKQGKSLVFTLLAANDSEYEIWDANRKSDLFKNLCGLDIGFQVEKTKRS